MKKVSGSLIKLFLALIMVMPFLSGCEKKSNMFGKTQIKFAVWGGVVERDIWNKIIDAFYKEHPEIEVKLELIPGGYSEKLQAMIAGDTAPDVFYLAKSPEFIHYAKNGALLNLNDYVKHDPKMNLKNFFPKALEMFKYDGNLYGLPKDIHTFALFYNKDIFDKAHMKYPNENWTWNTFLDACKKLTVFKNGYVDQFGFSCDERYWAILLYQNGGRILDDKFKKCELDKLEAVDAISFLSGMINKYKVTPTPAQIKDISIDELFITGKAAMFISGVWPGAEFRKSKNLNWDVAVLPKGKKRATLLVGSGPVIYSKSKQPAAAYEFVKFITGEEGDRIYSELGVSIPANRKVAYSDAFIRPGVPPAHQKVFLDELNYTFYLVTDEMERGDQVSEMLRKQLELVWLDKETPENACKDISEKINDFLSKE